MRISDLRISYSRISNLALALTMAAAFAIGDAAMRSARIRYDGALPFVLLCESVTLPLGECTRGCLDRGLERYGLVVPVIVGGVQSDSKTRNDDGIDPFGYVQLRFPGCLQKFAGALKGGFLDAVFNERSYHIGIG